MSRDMVRLVLRAMKSEGVIESMGKGRGAKWKQVKVEGRLMQQPLTQYQSQYYAWLLTRRVAGDSVESLASTLVDSQVDLNPHQVDAASSHAAIPFRAVCSSLTKWVSARPLKRAW